MNTNIDGININYRDEGSGEVVLLLHGWGSNIALFDGIFNLLTPKYRVVALDMPGFGQSDEPKEVWGVDEYLDFVIKFIESLELKDFTVLGHSFGGRVSILLAATYPALAGKIVFTDAAGIKPRRSLKYYCKVYTYKLCKKLVKRPGMVKFLSKLGIDVQKRVQNAGSSDYKQLSGVMRQTFVKVVNQDLTPYLKNIRSSSLLVYGAQDTDTPVRFGKIMEKKIPDAGLVVLDNAGHFSYLDQFPRYISIVKVFLEVNKQ